jgi:hypothetical protein
MGKEKKMQPELLHVPIESDIHATPKELAADIISYFKPAGLCLDPCAGNDVFFDLLPAGAEWCEILRGRDFYACTKKYNYIIGNPPFSHYSAWLRHSMKLAKNIIYLMPIYKIFSSNKMLSDLFAWGGITEIRRYGTGTDWGFPFGHALAAVYYMRSYKGPTFWSKNK